VERNPDAVFKTFDIRNALADQDMPEVDVTIFLDEKTGRNIEAVERKIKSLGAKDMDEIKELEGLRDELAAKLDESRFVIHLRGINRTRRNDISTKALSEFPYKRDMWNNDDPVNEANRGAYMDKLMFQAYIVGISDREGNRQEPDDNWPEVVDMILGSAPQLAIKKIGEALESLIEDVDWTRFTVQEPDFLSER
jgi:MoaA/NifB/PqqE/SkfB family radical SAM enzyme